MLLLCLCLEAQQKHFTDAEMTANILSIVLFTQVEDEVDEINAKVFTDLERKLQDWSKTISYYVYTHSVLLLHGKK